MAYILNEFTFRTNNTDDGMKRIDDQNFGGGQRSRPLRHISKGHRLCRENGAEQTDTFGKGGKRLHDESPKKSVCPMILRESAL